MLLPPCTGWLPETLSFRFPDGVLWPFSFTLLLVDTGPHSLSCRLVISQTLLFNNKEIHFNVNGAKCLICAIFEFGVTSVSPEYSLSECWIRKLMSGQFGRIYCFKDRKVLKGSTKATKKLKALNNVLDERGHSNILWWKEACRKPSTVQLVKRLEYSNLPGLDVNLKNGSLKEGTLNWEILRLKSKFPREVLLCRVGDFYEALGIDACILVE
ncbi:hypothetical protein FNV43_RR02217 [Rhamnella rubrinervis]|uniref:DNA mismatch repair protein MutS-like N-terminal domain-containing protein n=1 Tax=Rhamnella rubrinervis TaxID=2594499 RepID=A0A8K0HTG9_9ROSA|nr:hypothetical protein FNV43_RR02217 [Rhamnella rubrinervis]